MDIERIRNFIHSSHTSVRGGCEKLKKENGTIVQEIKSIPFTGTAGAVDSGFSTVSMYGIDVVLCRVSGVLFPYESSVRSGCTYLPKHRTPPAVTSFISSDGAQAGTLMQLTRLHAEISHAVTLVKTHAPDVFFLDGSILPLPSDRPSEGHELYAKTIQGFRELYLACKEKTMLIGIVKDSRGKRFANEFMDACETSDAFFMSHLLAKGQRSIDVSIFTKDNAITKDLGIPAEDVRCMYVRPSEDIPLRVEFQKGHDPSKIASTVHALCGPSQIHSYPPILIEADLRGKLDPPEIDRITYELEFHAGIRKLRRDTRPFR